MAGHPSPGARGVKLDLYYSVPISPFTFTTITHPNLTMGAHAQDVEALVHSDDPNHPANHICTLCAKFYTLGWVRPTLVENQSRTMAQ